MARQGNRFAALDGEEREVSMLIESIAAKVKVSSRQSKAKKNGQKYSPSPDSGRADRRRGNGGCGFYSKRYNGNDAEQSGNSRPNGYGLENGRADGYQYRVKGCADGDRYHAKGCADGDRNGAKGPDGDRQDNGHADGDEGWVKFYRYKEGRPFQDDMEFTSRNQNYRGERTGYYVDNRVPRSRIMGHETKEGTGNENQITSGDNITAGTEGNGSVTTEVSEEENQQRKRKDGEQKQKDKEQKRKEKERKQKEEAYNERERQRKEDAKKMTLKQYEEIIEKNKALGISKSQERKVTLDKDFESMQVVAKNKGGNIFIKLSSDEDKLEKKDSVGKRILKLARYWASAIKFAVTGAGGMAAVTGAGGKAAATGAGGWRPWQPWGPRTCSCNQISSSSNRRSSSVSYTS